MPKQEKVQLVEQIKQDLKDTNGLVLADFKGLSILQLDGLRRKITKEGGKAKIVKNALLSKAFEGVNINGLDPYLKNNTIMFSSKDDVLKILKPIADFAKGNEKFIIKAGYIDGQTMDKAGVVAMANMPSRKELLGMIAGGLNSVLGTFVGTLNGMMTSLTGTIEALEKKKSASN